MSDKGDEIGVLLPDEARLTRFGEVLRSTSVDELPELLNILKGDMALVGPRPLLIQYLPLYNAFQKRRHEVRPGLSGLAQVCGRNALDWEEKFNLDVQYIDHMSFLIDVKIAFMTIGAIFAREGIHSPTTMTAKPFIGSHGPLKEQSNV